MQENSLNRTNTKEKDSPSAMKQALYFRLNNTKLMKANAMNLNKAWNTNIR